MATEMPSPTPYGLFTLIQVGLPGSCCWQGTQLLWQQQPRPINITLASLQSSPDCRGQWQPVCSAVLPVALCISAAPGKFCSQWCSQHHCPTLHRER